MEIFMNIFDIILSIVFILECIIGLTLMWMWIIDEIKERKNKNKEEN